MNQEKIDRIAERFLIPVLGLLGLVGAVLAVKFYVWPDHDTAPPAPPSDMKLVSGDPRRDWVVAFHDQKRALTCYVNTQHGGIWCAEDVVIDDARYMMAYRDAGNLY